jgi:hypothetical protein
MYSGSRLRLGVLLERFLAGLIWLDPVAAAYCMALEVEDSLDARGDGLNGRQRWVAARSRSTWRPGPERLHVVEAGRP